MPERPGIFGLSAAEREYAYRFRDFLFVGEAKPSPEGFDPDRIKLIERTIRDEFHRRKQGFKRVQVRRRRP